MTIAVYWDVKHQNSQTNKKISSESVTTSDGYRRGYVSFGYLSHTPVVDNMVYNPNESRVTLIVSAKRGSNFS